MWGANCKDDCRVAVMTVLRISSAAAAAFVASLLFPMLSANSQPNWQQRLEQLDHTVARAFQGVKKCVARELEHGSYPSNVDDALRVGRFWDGVGKVFSLLGLSLPSFWVGLVLILFFSVYLEWLPSSGSGTALHLLMPAFALGWYFAAAHMRLTRSSMLEVLGSEYIKLARLKGIPESLVIAKHAFKNALIPVLTLAGINLVIMINVAVVVETVFAWPGIGRLLYEGITFRDFPVVQAVVLLGGGMIVAVNLLIDILYAVIDPRIRLEA